MSWRLYPFKINITPQHTCLLGGQEFLSMSCIHIFAAVWFTSMSLSPVGNPKLMTLPSTHHHAGYGLPSWLSPAESTSAPVSWVQPLPCHTVHLVGATPLWHPQTHTGSVSSKDIAAETCREMRTGAVVWGRTMANWHLMTNQPQHPGVSQAHSVMNLASAFIGISMCNSPAASLPEGWSPQNSTVNDPLLQHYTATLISHVSIGQLVTASTGMKFTLKQNWLSDEVRSSFDREKQSWHQPSSL